MDSADIDIVNFENICRFCMNAKRTLMSIFACAREDAPDISSKIKDCTSIEIAPDDGMPTKICLKCTVSLNSAYDFKKQCENSEVILRGILSAVNESAVSESWAEEENAATKASPSTEIISYFESDDDDIPLHSLLETTMREKRNWVKRKPRKTYKCEHCIKTFKKINVLIKHNIKFHGGNKEDASLVHKCQNCDERFKKWSDLMEHERETRHYGKEKCSYCSKSFSRSYIGEHLRSHTGERPFLCNNCGKSFSCQTSFQHHTMRCTKAEKKYQCSYCGQRFFLSYGLKEHVRIHTNEKPHVCGTCHKAFRRRSKLKQHEGIHSEKRPYLCSSCGRGFRQSQHLKEHMRVHTGVKPYVCDICNAAFTQGHCLKTHKLKHVNEVGCEDFR